VRQIRHCLYSALELPASNLIQKQSERNRQRKSARQPKHAHAYCVAKREPKARIIYQLDKVFQPNPLLINKSNVKFEIHERNGPAPNGDVFENDQPYQKRNRQYQKIFLVDKPLKNSCPILFRDCWA
jgi:hypothetical protein